MAKREIPEINAGSMADIAFLLLIFFLVTTTMDKDQAYLRQIPKKIEVQTPPVEVQERNILAIKANNMNQILIREQIVDIDRISEKVLEFYQSNEKKNVKGEFPFYSRISSTDITQRIKELDRVVEGLENQGAPEEMINVKLEEQNGWVKKRDALALYKAPALPEIDYQANIRIEVSNATHYEIFAKIHSEIQQAISELRDKEAKRLFNTPYESLKRKNELDANKLDQKDKLDLLDLLYPARIIEVTPKR